MTREHQLFIGPLVGALLAAVMLLLGCESAPAITAGVTLIIAWWWVTEPIDIPSTSLIPLAVFPALGIVTPQAAAESLGGPLIQLLLGGFLLSTAMEKSGAHRRIALTMVNTFGGNSGRRLVFGFMAASACLSMWISNAATTLMLLPIVLAVVSQTDDTKLQKALLLGVAFAASIGGIATPVGTPPNLVFIDNYKDLTGIEYTFLEWMKVALPIALVMLPIAALWLTRSLNQKLTVELPEVGKWRTEEVRTLTVFVIIAALWITRKQPFGGWSTWTGLAAANDAAVALCGVVAMFVLPSGKKDDEGIAEKLLDWKTAKTIPWGILILFSGGICVAKAFESSGLSVMLGNSFSGLSTVPVFVLILLICLAITFLTELTSNTATSTLLMPILAAVAVANNLDPILLMIPATLSASFAFMLPVATAPNAIIFSSGKLTVDEMAREGIVLNLLGVVVVSTLCYLLSG